MESLRKGHQTHVLAEKRLGDKYQSAVRAMHYDARIGALEQRKGYFGNWQNEVADRLPRNKTASMGKFGTPAPKTILIKFQFTSVTNLRTEGMFEVYKRDQVVPSALELKYLSWNVQ